MRRLDHHGDAARLQDAFDRVGDLRGQALLDLEPFGINLDDAGQFGDADDPPVRNIADPGAPDDWRDVVLAMAFEGNAAQDDHLVVAVDLLEGLSEDLLRLDIIAAEVLAEGAHEPLGRFAKAVALGILADP